MVKTKPHPERPLTLLIHGLHQNQYAMYFLARRLKRAGFATLGYDYPSLGATIDHHSRQLDHYLRTHHNPNHPINIVAHSLGGLVMRHFLVNYPHWQVARCVTLGTPHQGSVCANYVKQHLSPLVGKSFVGALDGTCPIPPETAEIGVIAGDKPFGVGMSFLAYHNHKYSRNPTITGKHDGAVYLFESVLPTATDYLILPVSHSGLLTDKGVANQVAYFLEHGKFQA